MQNLKLHRFLAAFLMIGMLTIFVSSCGDDDVEGCTDPDAENYNVNATVEDESCVYARDKFIGDYVGSFLCPGALAFISSDTLNFSIQPGLDPAKKDELIVTLMNVAGGITIDLTATALGDELIIDAELLGVPVMGVPGDVIGTGTATLNADGTQIMADLNMNIKVAAIMLDRTDDCTLVGTKQ